MKSELQSSVSEMEIAQTFLDEALDILASTPLIGQPGNSEFLRFS